MKSRLPLKPIITVIVLLWDLQGICKSLQVPSFFVKVPKEHFAGVSEPCKSLAEARKSAIYDVARQVLGSIGSRYSHRFVFDSSGNPKNPQVSIQDNLLRAADRTQYLPGNIINRTFSSFSEGLAGLRDSGKMPFGDVDQKRGDLQGFANPL